MLIYGPLEELWEKLLLNADSAFQQEMWVNTIRFIALARVKSERRELEDGWEHIYGENESDAWEQMAEELIGDWVDDSLPAGHGLFMLLGDRDYFDFDLCWHEKILFGKEACPFPSDVRYGLHVRLVERHGDDYGVNEEFVEELYLEWRYNLLRRVSNEVGLIKKSDQ